MAGRGYNGKVGRGGEDISCRYLMDKGHVILERNWRAGHLEIDIISMDKDGIHFVEVKSRCLPMEVQPQENVTRSKQKRLYEAAKCYLGRKDRMLSGEMECHFDIVAVILGNGTVEVDYFPDAFIPGI